MPKNIDLTGSFVNVRNTDLDEDIPHLYEICHLVQEAHPRIWDYMFYGPFASAQAMRACYDDVLKTDILLTVVNKTENKPVGLCAFLNIETKMGRLEIGHVLYPPCVQKTKTNTEATYLLLKHAFNDLQYRRVEWKCNNLNQDSKRTALRMGFQHQRLGSKLPSLILSEARSIRCAHSGHPLV